MDALVCFSSIIGSNICKLWQHTWCLYHRCPCEPFNRRAIIFNRKKLNVFMRLTGATVLSTWSVAISDVEHREKIHTIVKRKESATSFPCCDEQEISLEQFRWQRWRYLGFEFYGAFNFGTSARRLLIPLVTSKKCCGTTENLFS